MNSKKYSINPHKHTQEKTEQQKQMRQKLNTKVTDINPTMPTIIFIFKLY